MAKSKEYYIESGAQDVRLVACGNPYARARYESYVNGTSWQAKAYMAGYNGEAKPFWPVAEPVVEPEQHALDTSAYDAMRARPDGELFERRGLMVYANRARSAELRKRQWSDKVTIERTLHTARLNGWIGFPPDRPAIVRAALSRYENEQSRAWCIFPLNPRDTWRHAYACARTAARRAYPALDASATEQVLIAGPSGYTYSLPATHARQVMVYANRARSAELRKRQWSPTALNALAFHSFALSMDKDGDALVRAGLIKYQKEQARYRVSLIGPFNPRREWMYAYACARIDARHSSR